MKKNDPAAGAIVISSGMHRYRKLLFVVCAILMAVPVCTQSRYILTLGSLVLINSVFAMSIDLMSCMGLTSMGHASFFGFSAYSIAYLTVKQGMSAETAIPITIVLTILLAMLFSLITNKVWGTTYLIVNIALGQSVWGLAMKLLSVTNGDYGILGVKRPAWFGIPFSNPVVFYYFLFILFVLIFFFMYHYMESPFGITIRGIRQSPKRMSALGYDIYRHKFIAYTISATVAGLAGIMFVFFNRFVNPINTSTATSSKAFLMALMGGSGTIVGSILGASLVVLLENFISAFTQRWVSLLGMLYIFTVMFSPRGIMGGYDWLRERLGNRWKI